MIVWRISAFASLDGLGGLRFSARWHTAGRPIVYAADHPAGALCEMLAHVDRDDLPDSYQLLKVRVSEALTPQEPALTAHWLVDVSASRAVGDAWLAENRSALLRVPSALVPEASNILINPRHSGAAALVIESATHVPLDPRFRGGPSTGPRSAPAQ